MKLCGKGKCDFFNRIGRNTYTPNVKVINCNLLDEALRWARLSVPSLSNPGNFSILSEARKDADKKKLLLGKLVAFLPTAKDDFEETKLIKHSKKFDSRCLLLVAKARATIKCDDCVTCRYFL